MTELPTSLSCNHARLRQEHGPHDWEPQPGMDPVHCPGHGQPEATEATDAPPLRRLESRAVTAALTAMQAQGEWLPMAAVEAVAKAVAAEITGDAGQVEDQSGAGEGDEPELTVEEDRALADDLGLQLYQAQDALAFVAECCIIAEREQRPITTADVREWLKGAQCGRQSPPARRVAAGDASRSPTSTPTSTSSRSSRDCPRLAVPRRHPRLSSSRHDDHHAHVTR
ncbi:hypothetical protein OH540_09495 [Streptomyces sp. BPPL-273]|uniref:hypothetical protein n=1 Tax=Streptomyces sp. BPPL-273 TaxID=2987533 RepID=UPI0024AFBB75|nr:hypothetical protein [Streptomyces sp. BPPL-273]WHM30256.1 hypothetical protein OH540_09495 [Streptomyces sp. BPPL-273]